MESTKTSKKALRGIINDSILEAVSKLALPPASKKTKKLISKNAKKLASVFAESIKRENKKKHKAEKALTYVEDVLKGDKKVKKSKSSKVVG